MILFINDHEVSIKNLILTNNTNFEKSLINV
jgi:hypothetical protein